MGQRAVDIKFNPLELSLVRHMQSCLVMAESPVDLMISFSGLWPEDQRILCVIVNACVD
ncbi:hypothetical protein GCM10007391_19400 [Alteromonas halophila]|uniref:Uncharacterized protein n=1 Tax=Alteromonas halophila TaxID=516698 RepID=A0A918MYG1_9ALTE|nr:hypothetical protein GCM10007391_19400 [Alteromonas halophila]